MPVVPTAMSNITPSLGQNITSHRQTGLTSPSSPRPEQHHQYGVAGPADRRPDAGREARRDGGSHLRLAAHRRPDHRQRQPKVPELAGKVRDGVPWLVLLCAESSVSQLL